MKLNTPFLHYRHKNNRFYSAGVWQFLLFLLFLFPGWVNGQNLFKRMLGGFIHDTVQGGKARFVAYPTLAFSPETNLEVGFNALYVYNAKGDTTNRLSEVSAFTFFTLKNQYGFWLDHFLYSHQDKYFFLGKIRLQSFPLLYFGTGVGTPEIYQARVDANQISIKERVLRKLYKNLFLGLEFDFQQIQQVRFHQNPRGEKLVLPTGSEGSTNLGVGLGIVYDDRHNVLNVRKGFFSELGFVNFTGALSDYKFHNVFSDTRIFRPIGKKNVFAAQLLGQFNTGNIPFNQLALMGGETMMRGYYTGRYRDRNQLAAQTEIRFLPLPLGFSKRIGATVFGSVATVSPTMKGFLDKELIWAGGAGLRFLIFPKKDIFTRVDYAFTREGGGLYIYIGEAF